MGKNVSVLERIGFRPTNSNELWSTMVVIKILSIVSHGKKCFSSRTNRFSTNKLERIMVDNRDTTVSALCIIFFQAIFRNKTTVSSLYLLSGRNVSYGLSEALSSKDR